MGRCIICNKEIGAKDIYLLNGEAIHRECVDMLKSEETELDANINMCFEKKIQLESKISKYSSFFYRLRSFFNSDYKSRLKDLEIQNLENNNKLFELKIERNKILENKRNTLFDIYSNWPERPPDWEYRRRVLLNKQDYCMECGEIKGSLHVYHKRPISEGGNHSEENLVVICASCYSKMHGDRDLFIGADRRRETAFTKKYIILREACNQ